MDFNNNLKTETMEITFNGTGNFLAFRKKYLLWRIKKFVNNCFYNSLVYNFPTLIILEGVSQHWKNEHLHNNHQVIMAKLFWLEKIQKMQEKCLFKIGWITFCNLKRDDHCFTNSQPKYNENNGERRKREPVFKIPQWYRTPSEMYNQFENETRRWWVYQREHWLLFCHAVNNSRSIWQAICFL